MSSIKNLTNELAIANNEISNLRKALGMYVALCGNTAYMVDRGGLQEAYALAESALDQTKKKKELNDNSKQLAAQIDGFWEYCSNGFEIEDRNYFEKKYPDNPLFWAAHYLWKRNPVVESGKSAEVSYKEGYDDGYNAGRDEASPNSGFERS